MKEGRMELRKEGRSGEGKSKKWMEKSKERKKRNIRMQIPARIVTVENSAFVKDSEARQGQLQVWLDVKRQQLAGEK